MGKIESNQKQSMSHRILELDVLRGVAALAVLLSHYTALYDHLHGLNNRLGFEFTIGGYGVFLFFVISGYVILMTIERCSTGLDFCVSRFSRIFPAYWAAIILTFSILHYIKVNPPGVVTFLVNFTMLERFVGLEHLDAVYWTLNVELSFYIWMLLLYKLKLLSNINLVVIAALVSQMIVSLFQRHSGIHFSQGIQAVFLLEYVNLFCAGMVFYKIKSEGFKIISGILLLWCIINTYIVPFRQFPCQPPQECGVVAVCLIFIIFYLAISGKISWIITSPTLFLGTISYTLYLVHDEIGRAVMNDLSIYGFSPWVTFTEAMSLSLILASFLTFAVEKPAMKLMRQVYTGYKNGRYRLTISQE